MNNSAYSNYQDKKQILMTAIDYLKELHLFLAKFIDFDKKDNNLAAYYLFGKSITDISSVLTLLENGYIGEAGLVMRSIFETTDLIEYFILVENTESNLKKWFNDEIIAPRIIRNGLASLYSQNSEYKDHYDLLNNNYKITSKYAHPTLRVSKANMNHNTKKYDYECNEIKTSYPEYPFSLSQTLIGLLNVFAFCF